MVSPEAIKGNALWDAQRQCSAFFSLVELEKALNDSI